MWILIRLASRNLIRHPWRSGATILGISLGIAAVFATLSIGDNVEANVRRSLEATAGKAALLITPGAQGRAVLEVRDLLASIAGIKGVRTIHPVLNRRAEPLREIPSFTKSIIPGVDTGFQISGRITEAVADIPAEVAEGELPGRNSNGIAIAEGFARGRNIELGETLLLSTTFGEAPVTVTGFLRNDIGYATTNGGRVGIMHLEDLQNIFHLSGRASYLEVIIEPEAKVAGVKESLEAAVGEQYVVTQPAGSGNIVFSIVETLQSGLTILAATLLVLGGFLAYNTFMASVVERQREYALLRTICLRKRDVKRLALLEAGIASLFGCASGFLLGLALSYVLTRLNALSMGFEFHGLVIPTIDILIASGVGITVSLLAGLLPAMEAARTTPLTATRIADSAEIRRGTSLIGWLITAAGVALALAHWPGLTAIAGSAVAMALLFIGISLTAHFVLRLMLLVISPLLSGMFGLAGRLGGSFTQRNAPRNGVAIATVVVSLSLVIGVGAMVAGINRAISDWIDTTVVGDMFVTSPVSFPEGFERLVRDRVPAVDAISGVGIRVVRFRPTPEARGRSIALILVDPERFDPENGFGRFQFIPGEGNDTLGYQTLKSGKVLAANTMLDRFGVSTGDSVSLRTNEGFRNFEVGGVVVDFTGGGEAFIASIEDSDLFGGGTPDLYVMTVRKGRDPTEVRQQLLRSFPDLYLDITLNHDYRKRIFDITRQSFFTTNTLLLLAIIIATLGVANTLGMNLAGRQHEIAVLRALGLTRGNISTLVASEGIVIVLAGTLLGIGCGVLLSRVITAGASALTGYHILPNYPWLLIVAALISSPLIGFLASILPARRAARLTPMAALKTEG